MVEAQRKLGLFSAVAIGVGGMVGGGIFAVLGLSVQLSGGGAPVAFVLAGVVALLTAYSYARLSVAFPDQGGTVTFLDQVFGRGIFAGGLNVLLWMSYVIMLSLYASAFGSYASSLLPGDGGPLSRHLFLSAAILVLTLLNALGAAVVGRAETGIVVIKVVLLLIFVAAGIWTVSPAHLAPATWAPPLKLVAGGMLIFVAYEGFELIANTGADIRDPARTLPRAYFISVGFVVALYVAVAVVTVGQLPLPTLIAARDYALAEAARPQFGQAGFVLIAIAAMLSTASAINATLYGAARVSYIIARDGELPAMLERKLWSKPLEGLLLTSGATLIVANAFDLSSIAMMGSAGFLLIFAVVNIANARAALQTRSRAWISLLGAGACLAALAALIWQTAETALARLGFLIALIGAAFAIEALYRRTARRRACAAR